MTATSTLTPPALTRSWNRAQRVVALVFVVALFIAVAFAAGRASIHTHGSSTITPPSALVPSASDPTGVQCHVGPC